MKDIIRTTRREWVMALQPYAECRAAALATVLVVIIGIIIGISI